MTKQNHSRQQGDPPSRSSEPDSGSTPQPVPELAPGPGLSGDAALCLHRGGRAKPVAELEQWVGVYVAGTVRVGDEDRLLLLVEDGDGLSEAWVRVSKGPSGNRPSVTSLASSALERSGRARVRIPIWAQRWCARLIP